MERERSAVIVDDIRSARMMARIPLEKLGFQVREFDAADPCLEALVARDAPDVILLDVEMPGMIDGVALCQAIREGGNSDSHVIFISSHDDLAIRLRAYDAGGDDYLVKPYSLDELERKLRLALQAQDSRRELVSRAGYAQKTAFAAMSTMGEMGVVMEFLRRSFSCSTPEQLAAVYFTALNAYEVEGFVELRFPGGASCFSSKGECSWLEKSIIGHVREMERLFQFQSRLVINHPRITVVVGLPNDDSERIGRLRDHMAILTEGAEMRLGAMEGETRRLDHAQWASDAAAEVTASLEGIEKHQRESRSQIMAIADDHLGELEKAFVNMGMSEAQENRLLNLTRQMISRIGQTQGVGMAVGECLHAVIKRLREVTGSAKSAGG